MKTEITQLIDTAQMYSIDKTNIIFVLFLSSKTFNDPLAGNENLIDKVLL
jgi:hypothetical protein